MLLVLAEIPFPAPQTNEQSREREKILQPNFHVFLLAKM